mmetsp:Transcript_39765/g.97737  ORF Transcript_39765/g.97737 Transcript_39765/m.97737 type:complete len:210 (-) Transcript_39765:1166-1795(-)
MHRSPLALRRAWGPVGWVLALGRDVALPRARRGRLLAVGGAREGLARLHHRLSEGLLRLGHSTVVAIDVVDVLAVVCALQQARHQGRVRQVHPKVEQALLSAVLQDLSDLGLLDHCAVEHHLQAAVQLAVVRVRLHALGVLLGVDDLLVDAPLLLEEPHRQIDLDDARAPLLVEEAGPQRVAPLVLQNLLRRLVLHRVDHHGVACVGVP